MNHSSADFVAGLLVLICRGVLLWVLVPSGFIAWLMTSAWRGQPFGQFLGWLDWNLVSLLQRSLLRPFFTSPRLRWIPAAEMRTVTHRIGVLDPS